MKLNNSQINALKIILDKLNNTNIKWVLGGSTNLALQGVNVIAHDIDIATNMKGAYEIESILKQYVIKKVKFTSNDKFRSYYGLLKIENISVEILGDCEYYNLKTKKWEKGSKTIRRKYIDFKGYTLPVYNLETELNFYKGASREEKAKKIQERIKALTKNNDKLCNL